MNLIPFTVFDPTTGEVAFSGHREEKHLPVDTATKVVRLGIAVRPNTHRINPATLQPEIRAVTKRQAWRDSMADAEPDELEVLFEAFRAKMTPADLNAAAGALRQRRKAAAKAGK